MNKIKAKSKLYILSGVHKSIKKQDDGWVDIISTIIFEPKSYRLKRDDNAGTMLHIKGDIQLKTYTGIMLSSKILVISQDIYIDLVTELLRKEIYSDNKHLRYKLEIDATFSEINAGNYQIGIKATHEYIETQSLFND